MKNAKRWLAVILAVTLLGSNAIYQLGTTLSANETEAVTESQQDESENAVAVQEGTQQEDTGKATVQEVTPQEDKSDASAQESKPVQEEQQTKETQTESQTPAAVEAPQAEQTQQAQQAAPANAGQPEPEAQPKTPVAQTYDVKINKPDLDGGQIKVWGTDGIQTDVTSYDGNNQYVKEVTEGEDFNFQITRNDGFEIENVTVNGAQIAPESTDGNVSTYKLSGVAEEKAIIITYNKVETPAEENQDGEAAADEGIEAIKSLDQMTADELFEYLMNVDANQMDALYEQYSNLDDLIVKLSGEQQQKLAEKFGNGEDGIATMSISGATTVEVGKSITLTSDRGGNYDKWSVSDDNKASITANANNSTSAVLTGKKAGNVTVTHSWYSRYLGSWYEQSETFDVTVTKKAMTRIYVYVKLNVAAGVSTSGWNINKDGWYTIGYVDVSSDSVPAADEKNLDRYYPEYSSAVQAALGNIHYYSGNQSVSQGIDLQGSNVNWSASGYGLKIASGASDYGNETGSTKQWHLDGLLTIKKIEKHNVTINYVYEDGSKAADSVIFKDVETGKSVSQTSPNIEGYTADQEKVTVTVLKDDVTVTVTYKKNYPKEKITIKAGSAEKVYDGTPLTEEKYTYTQGILLDGDVLTATTSGSRTEVGTSYNVIAGTAYSIKHGDKDVTSKYNVGLESGTLTVKPQSIVPENPDYRGVTVNKPSDKTYDGKEHKWTPTVKDGDKVLVEGTDYMVSYNKTDYTNVTGAIEVTITGIGNYSGSVVKSYQILPRKYSIKTESASKAYDGEALTAGGKVSGLVEGETVDFKVTGSQTVVGNSENSYELKWTGSAKKSNYELEKKEVGTLSVTESTKEVVVTTTGETHVYDGKAHGATVTVTGLPKGYQVTKAVSNATATDVTPEAGVEATADELVIVNTKGKDVTKDLKITYNNGTIKITKAPVTINTPDASKVYDGTPLTAAGTIDGIVKGETVSFKTTGTITNKGTKKNSYELKWDGTAKESNYEVKDSVGTLKITEQSIVPENPNYRGVTVNKPSDKTYDGKEHKWTPTVKDGDKVLVERTDYTVSYNKTDYTNVTGAIEVTITGIGNYSGSVTRTYQITPVDVTITTDSDNKPYDGTPLTADGRIEGLVNDEEVSFAVTGSQTAVGSSDNTYTLVWDKTAKETNYNIASVSVGTLTVTESAAEIVVTTTGGTFTYDGQPHGATVSVSTLPTGYTLKTAASTATATNVADGEVTATADQLVIVNAAGEDVTAKLNITYNNGTIKIIPKAATVTTDSAEKVYDGTPLTAPGRIEGLVEGENVTLTMTGNQTVKGESANNYELTWDQNAVSGNYTITDSVGTLKVTEQSLDPKDPESYRNVQIDDPENKTYNGAEQKWAPTVTDAKGNVLVEGTDYTVFYDKDDFTNVTGAIKATITGIGNYKGTVEKSYQILPRELSVTTDSDEKVYDGEPLTAGGSVDGLVAGEELTLRTTGSQTEVGKSNNTYEIVWDKTAQERNYKVTGEKLGTLEVTPQSINPGPNPENPDPSYDGIQIDSPSDVEYDGQAHKWSPTVTDKNGNALTEGTDYEVSYDKDDFTDVKTITVTITGKGNYTGTVTRVYNILAAPLIIRTEKAEKTYDGKPLTNENMTIEGLKNGEVVVHKTTGSQTEVGNSDNTYELDWKSKETTAKESNYIIKEVSLGKLVVKETEDEIVVTTTGGTFTYDGQPHGATVEVSELPEGYTLQTAESDATATDVTTEAVTADADRLVIVNAAGVDVTANLKITRVTGEIVVNPATVTVTTPNASKVYDGTPLTAAGTITGLVNGETVSFATTGTITNVGTATNSYSLVWDQTAKETNYTVSENLGTLTVTAPANNNPSVTPTPPDNPRPNNPTRPSGQTTEPTGNAFVDNVVTPVVETVKEKAAKIQEVFNSDDEDVPLADQNLDNHKCCILHFLIMLITLLVYALATKSMKKRQKKLHEVREELDCELARRGLPLSREKE